MANKTVKHGLVTDGDYTYLDEHWVMCGSAESLRCPPEAKITLDVGYTAIKKWLSS